MLSIKGIFNMVIQNLVLINVLSSLIALEAQLNKLLPMRLATRNKRKEEQSGRGRRYLLIRDRENRIYTLCRSATSKLNHTLSRATLDVLI